MCVFKGARREATPITHVHITLRPTCVVVNHSKVWQHMSQPCTGASLDRDPTGAAGQGSGGRRVPAAGLGQRQPPGQPEKERHPRPCRGTGRRAPWRGRGRVVKRRRCPACHACFWRHRQRQGVFCGRCMQPVTSSQGVASIAMSPALPLALAAATQATVPVARASLARGALAVHRLRSAPEGAALADALAPLLDAVQDSAARVARTALDANASVLNGAVSECTHRVCC